MSWFTKKKVDEAPGPCARAILKAGSVLEMKRITPEYPGFQAQAEVIAEIAERLVRLESLCAPKKRKR